MKDLLTIEEVCEIAKVSKPTIYRRVKEGTFPKPTKVKSTAVRGPKEVNRWERGQVMGWLLKGNDPNWMKQPVKDIKAACAKVDKVEETPDVTARMNDGATDFHYDDPEPAAPKPNFVLWGVLGGALSGIAWALFGG